MRIANRLRGAAGASLAGRAVLGPVGAGNDYIHVERRLKRLAGEPPRLTVSVIVPVYNRRAHLARTLAGLCLQDYPPELLEVVIADDGSTDDPQDVIADFRSKLAIRLVRQPNHGYRLARARNLATTAARGTVIISLDCDMIPEPGFVRAHARWFHATEAPLVVIGWRKHVDPDHLAPAEILADFDVVRRLPEAAGAAAHRRQRDWRLDTFTATGGLKHAALPIAVASGGNLSYRRSDAMRCGLHDEAFRQWGGEDTDFAYRMERIGAYFVPEPGALAYHQEHHVPLSRAGERRDTRVLLGRKVPVYRRFVPHGRYLAPKVSVYVPACNAGQWIGRALDSALRQTLSDLEVCVCDDGSTDATPAILEQFSRNDDRVRWVRQPNGGIACASSRAIDLCRGQYILQLDADDELLPRAAAVLADHLDHDHTLSMVHAGYETIDAAGRSIASCVPAPHDTLRHLFANTVSHPRMFRARDFHRTSGFDVTLSNAVDYDLALKLGERGHICSVPDVLYRYRIHGRNTSLVNLEEQRRNHARVVAAALSRRGLSWTLSGGVDQDTFEILPVGLPLWRRKLLRRLYGKYAQAVRKTRTGGNNGHAQR